MSICWFCEKNEVSSEARIEVNMRLILEQKETVKRRTTRYNQQTVIVPRCSKCKEDEEKLKKYSGLSAFPSLIIGILIPVFISRSNPDISTFILILIGLTLFLCCLFGAIYLILKFDPITKSDSKAIKDHPTIQIMMNKGWILDDGTGKQTENKM